MSAKTKGYEEIRNPKPRRPSKHEIAARDYQRHHYNNGAKTRARLEKAH